MRKMLAGAAATTLLTGVLTGGQAYAATSPWKLSQRNDLANSNGIWALSISAGGSAWAGGYQSADGKTTPLVQHLDGKGWTTHSAPAGVSGRIRSLAVSSSTNVWAFASDGDSTHASRWDGRTWTTTSLPGDFLPTGSAAIGPTNVWAVAGGTEDRDPEEAAKYAEHWTGKGWKKAAVPAPARAVAASSAKYVWAVGTYKRQPAVMRWNGTSWKLVKTPKVKLPIGTWGVLNDVLALSSKNVWAVGGVQQYCGADHDDICAKPLIMHWNGKAWSTAVDAKETRAYEKVASDGSGGLWLLRGGWNAALVHKVGSKLTVTTTPRPAGAGNDLRALATYGKTAWTAGTELSDNATKSSGVYFRSR